MTWLAAYLFCMEQNSDLVSPSITSQILTTKMSPMSGGCWLNDRKAYAHSDPLEGWKWLDGSQYNVTRRWGIDGGLVGTGLQRQCATIGLQSGIWNASNCTIPHHFVCRKKVCKRTFCISVIKSGVFSLHSAVVRKTNLIRYSH